MSSPATDDIRILELKELIPPARLIRNFPCTEDMAAFISNTRRALHRILHGIEDRLMVVIGPCSIHDPKAAPSRHLLSSWLFIFSAGCLVNSLLLDFSEGYLFVLLNGILLGCAGWPGTRPQTAARGHPLGSV